MIPSNRIGDTDGRTRGGVRGIVELVLLNAIQKELGSHVPIQDFFDLIVGTRYVLSVISDYCRISDTKSTGGIIALGLGVKRWGVEECIQRFKELCPQAFTGRSYPAFKHFELLAHKSWYKTKPLESALKSAFGDKLLFGGPTSDGPTNIRVAVTSTTASENRPVILTNYNTREDERESCKLCLKGSVASNWCANRSSSTIRVRQAPGSRS